MTVPFVPLAGLALVLLLAGRASPATVRVDSRATGGNDGTSWANAFVLLEDALLVPGPVEIWVASGSYAPAGPGGDRNAAFRFGTGQALYGGFRGDETSRSGRDPSAHPTVLTGDLNGDDLPGFENSAENSYHVLRCKDSDATAIVDGFIVRGGSAREASGFNSAGGGVLIQNASPRFTGCRFETCFARSGGVAVVLGGSPSFAGCSFRGNMVQNGRGGAVSVGGSGSAAFTSCVFEDNLVRGGVGAVDGGAIFIDLGSGASVSGCKFERNSSTSSSRSIVATGGAITSLGTGVSISGSAFRSNLANVGGAVWTARDIAVDNCIFDRNQAIVGDGAFAGGGVGGGLVAFGAAVTFADCTSVANEADDGGGIYSADGASIAVTNSILWASRDASGTTAQAQIKGPGSKTIGYSCVQNLFASGSYPTCIEGDPFFVDADGPDNAPGTADDNFRLLAGSPCIDAGSNAAIPAGTTADMDGGPRRRDDPATLDTGSGTAPIVDMGAHEYPGASGSGTVSVASGAAFTAGTAVSLTITASGGVTSMAFSNDGLSWTSWEISGTSKSWNLTADDGTKTVFARFGNASGSVLAEACDSIVLDGSPPTGSIAIEGGAGTTTKYIVTLTLAAADAGSGVASMRLRDGGAAWPVWEPYAASRSWTLPAGPGVKTVEVQYRDGLGNASGTFGDTIEVVPAAAGFVRGDANEDRSLDISDSIRILFVLYAGFPTACRDALDLDDSGVLELTDAIHGLNFIFLLGPAPAAPFPTCGADLTGTDVLTCETFAGCP